jgi:hypothetical protein
MNPMPSKTTRRSRAPLAAIAFLLAASHPAAAPAEALSPAILRTGLDVSIVPAPPAGPELRLAQPYGRRGPTSIRHRLVEGEPRRSRSPNPADPNGGRFYARDRDLGQTFTVPADSTPFRLEAVTLRVGPVSADFDGTLADARERGEVFLQLFEVSGEPVVHDNGTTGEVLVSKAYPHPATMALADDYITGETYRTLLVARGGRLPRHFELGDENSGGPESGSKGSLLRFDLGAAGAPVLQPGRRYAFLVGFEKAGPTMALPLDNWDYLNTSGATPEQVRHGAYAGGHAIRREGRVPEPWNNLDRAFSDDPSQARFPDSFTERLAQQPGTWGRPDVDTYRDLVFWISGSDAP